jgi:DNA-directed RNA polymerase subunit M/transcription elongation factor TFIIS
LTRVFTGVILYRIFDGERQLPVVSRYCNICNRLITVREIETGEAIVYQTYYYCPKCKKEAMPIIEAIRRRQEREQEKEAQEAREKKSSTRHGTAARHKPSSSAHKLRKTRSGIFQSRKPGPSGPRRPHAARRPHGDTGRAHPPPVHEPTAPAQEPAGDTYKPAAEFNEVKAKASGSHAPAEPAAPVQEDAPAAPQQPAAREPVSAPDSERIEVISELQAPEAQDVEGMSPGEVAAAAEPRESSSSGEEQLAASGITFEDVVPAVEPPPVEPEGQPASLQPVEEATAGEAAEPEAREVIVEPEAVQVEEDTPEQKPAAEPAPVRIPSAVGKFPKHLHPGKRRIAHVPPQKKKPWLFIVVILLMALGGGGLIAYKQFFMPEKKEESIEERQEREEKEQYAQLEKEIDSLAADARKIVTDPGSFARS